MDGLDGHIQYAYSHGCISLQMANLSAQLSVVGVSYVVVAKAVCKVWFVHGYLLIVSTAPSIIWLIVERSNA